MTVNTFLIGLIATLICVTVLYLLGDRWPVMKRLALAVAALFLLYVGVDFLISSIDDINRGWLADITRSGSRVVSLRVENPALFWMNATLRLACCIFTIGGALWTLRRAMKRD